MSTTNSVISQLQSDLQLANNTTGANDTTIHDAIATLISGFGSGGGKIKKYTGTIICSSGNGDVIAHNVNSSRYLIIVHASSVPEVTNGVWFAKDIIGFYDENGIEFDNNTYKNVSAGLRHKDSTKAAVVWYGNNSTTSVFTWYGNSLPPNVECTWELYDLSDA